MGAQHGHFGPPLYSTGTAYLGDPLAHQAKPPAPIPLQAIAPKPSPFDFNHARMAQQNPQHGGPMSRDFGYAHPPLGSMHPSIPNPLLPPGHAMNRVDNDGRLGQQPHHHHQKANGGAASSGRQGPPQHIGNGRPLGHCSENVVCTLSESDYDVGLSDEEMHMAESDDDQLTLPDPRTMVASGSRHLFWPYPWGGTAVRTFSAFAQEQALAEYMDYAPNSELRNQAMRTIFMHFVSVTGPTMSLYERDPSPPEEPGQFEGNAELGHNLFSCESPVLVVWAVDR